MISSCLNQTLPRVWPIPLTNLIFSPGPNAAILKEIWRLSVASKTRKRMATRKLTSADLKNTLLEWPIKERRKGEAFCI